jgi:hypothetical protein
LSEFNFTFVEIRNDAITVSAGIEALKVKLKCTVQYLGQGQFQHLPSLKNFFAQNLIIICPDIMNFNIIKGHSCDLESPFSTHFSEDFSKEYWIKNPFSIEDTTSISQCERNISPL